MEFPTKEIIAALVTLSVAALGYLQWRRGKRSGRFIDDREIAYKEVWQSLEDIHLSVRSNDLEPPAFDEMIKKANVLLIRHSLHIADVDRASAADYIVALRNLANCLAKTQLAPQVRYEIEITGEHVAPPPELLDAYNAYEAARQSVMEKFRHAIGSGQI